MKKSEVELYDFIQRPAKHKAGKYWHIVSWVILFLVVAFLASLIYATAIASAATTRQQVITNAQILNGIPQRHYQITFQ